ncbi:MAG: hypothetical protein Q7S44_01220 [bacterium]|nr:hypothetical protein [bacterium]
MNNNSQTSPTCNQCGSKLILLETKVQKLEKSFSAMTTTIFRCSNKICQDEIDKRTAKRIELRNEQEIARQNRLNRMHLGNK